MRREILPYALLSVLVAAAASWPLVRIWDDHLGAPFAHPDLQCGLWWPKAVAESLLAGRSPFFRPEFAWPDGQDARLLLWNYAVQVLFAPFVGLGNPIWAVNFVTLGSMALNAFGAALAARWLTGSRAGAAVAACVAGASAYAFLEGTTGRPEQALWAPCVVYVAGLVEIRRRPGSRWAILASAASLAAAGAVYWFYAYFLVVVTVLLAAAWLWRRELDRNGFRDLALVGLGSAVLVAPFAWPVASALVEHAGFFDSMRTYAGEADLQQARSALVVPRSFFGPFFLRETSYHTMLGSETHTSHVMPVLALPLALLVWRRAERPAVVVAGVVLLSLVFSAGPILQIDPGRLTLFGRVGVRLPMAVLNLLPGFDRLWWPYRWIATAEAGMALAAAILVARARRPWPWATAGGLFCIVECMLILRGGVPPTAAPMEKAEVPGALEAIGKLGGVRPILQLPMGADAIIPVGFTMWHRQPIDGGLGWGIPVVRTKGYERRRLSVPLMRAMQSIQDTDEAPPRGRPWTEEETGGFHYVLQYPGGRDYDNLAHAKQLELQIGRPFYCDRTLAAWAIPGVGEVPPEYAGVPSSSEDPCLR